MNTFQQPIFYALLMCIAGIGIAIMAALNSRLGTMLHSTSLATTILFVFAAIVSLIYLFLSGGMPKNSVQESIPTFYYFGGLFVIFYIFSITWVAPKFGVGNAISLVLLGQLISMAVIDHFSLFGVIRSSLSIERLIGLIFMVIGVFMTVRRF
jgi:transporter family-2 protein